MGRTYEMAAHLLLADQAFSRNRHYDAHRDPRYRRAIALYRRLRALVIDLERAHLDGSRLVVVEETHDGRPAVRLEIVSPRSRRTSFLDKPSWEVLMLHPSAQAALGS